MANDRFRDELRAQAEIAVLASGKPAVRLHGGPLDGWLVKENAPALEPTWYKTWPPQRTASEKPGHYVISDAGTWADWELYEDPGSS